MRGGELRFGTRFKIGFATPYAQIAEACSPRGVYPTIRIVLGERQTNLTILCWPSERDLVHCILENSYAAAMIARWHPNV